MQNKKQYACYIRHNLYGEEGRATTNAQRDANLLHVQQRGGVVVAEYADEGISGASLNRSGFQKLLEAAKKGAFNVIAVTHASRIARGPEFLPACQQLEEEGVAVETSQE